MQREVDTHPDTQYPILTFTYVNILLILGTMVIRGKSTKSKRSNKQKKPYADYPLTAHPSGRWCKKYRQKTFYFGKLDDWQGALERFNREWPYIVNGQVPPPNGDEGCTLRTLCNSFLNNKQSKLKSNELSAASFDDYFRTCELVVNQFGRDRRVDGLCPDDFERFRESLATRLGVVSLKNEINRCRILFKYAYDQRLIDQPIRFGQSFDRPSAKMLRKARNEAGPKMFEANEICTLIDNANVELRAMILLGINCGFGNTDVANLPQSAIDFERMWVNYPRPKTEIHRRCPLWNETVNALKESIAVRPNPKSPVDADLCFVTRQGNKWVRVQPSQNKASKFSRVDTLAHRFAALQRVIPDNSLRLGFYALRHTFETIGGESRDQVAVNAIMGHTDNTMSGLYRERISDERLIAVTDSIRKWLLDQK